MKKTIAFIIATLGFCSYPDLLLNSLERYNTLTPVVYIVYVTAVMSFAYFVRVATEEQIKKEYKWAEKAAEKAVFLEKMKAYSETEEKI